MRRERASENAVLIDIKQTKKNFTRKDRVVRSTLRDCVYPIALRLDTRLPQSELKDHSEAITTRKARQTRRKSKTHKAN